MLTSKTNHQKNYRPPAELERLTSSDAASISSVATLDLANRKAQVHEE
jgi:hypothetical protein